MCGHVIVKVRGVWSCDSEGIGECGHVIVKV